ncbi:apolipoprotein F precursor-like [Scleropages formosus]|uniref:Apolipoprotein F n=1 Tax=Scleropages formosus TaxID=113540 RepID=A0A0P7UI27_SCLFO|nr:apolipoprotein F [Scleropages formosus]KPP73917.1 apolipoprotein F precursor-like [Scleropages formosus]
MMDAKLKWLIVAQLLLTDCCRSQVDVPRGLESTASQNTRVREGGKGEDASHLPGPPLEPGFPSGADEAKIQSAHRLVMTVAGLLQGKMRLALQGNASCEDLLAAATLEKPSALFLRELLGLSLVPVLVAENCPQEAQTLVLQLFDLLGVGDTEELLLDLEDLMERSSQPRVTGAPGRERSQHHIEAIMFNIQQLAKTGVSNEETRDMDRGTQGGHGECQGWTRVNGTSLLGEAVEEEGEVAEAVRVCESLGARCAGVSLGEASGLYRAVLRKGSRIVPCEDSECWIRECQGTRAGRARRSAQRNCVNKREERIYSVVEWIPAVSTLYSLGTAVYYASVNCSETAKERAILSAVDLGTDALMAVTGGTVGVAGYALGAGVKTGVKAGIKYLLNNMKHEEDVIVNQNIWSASISVE